MPLSDFGPQKLKAVRQKMIEKGWSRKNINKQVCRVRAMFKWAVAQEYRSAAAAAFQYLSRPDALCEDRKKGH